MPRTYVKKKQEPVYTQEDVQRAVFDVENKIYTYTQAEEKYSVPRSVIFHRIKGRKVSLDKLGAGRATALTHQDEIDLVNCLKARSRMGYPCNMEDTINIVEEFVKANNLKTPFKGGRPGKDWYYGFLQRHPSLSVKKPELLQSNRKNARKPDVVYDFYSELNQVVNDCGLTADKAAFVFNCDESGFSMDPSRIKAIGEKGSPLVRISGGSGRESTTVLATVSADGNHLPPFIVFKGLSVQPRWIPETSYPGTLYSASANGWMEESHFYQWFVSSFIPHVKKLREAKNCENQKAILLFDGHKSHISYRTVKAAMDNKIDLIKFPSHLTDKIQPLDKCVFGPLKYTWEKKLISFGKTQMERQSNLRLTKAQFSTLLGEIWADSMKSTNIVSGFKSAGLFPVDATKFPESSFNPKELREYKRSRALVLHKPCESNEIRPNATNVDSNHDVNPGATNVDSNHDLNPDATSVDSNHDVNPMQPTCSHMGSRNGMQLKPQQDNQINEEEAVNGKYTAKDKTPVKSDHSKVTTPNTPTSIIEIFTSKLMNKPVAPVPTADNAVKKERKIPRLKPERYGEVLTRDDVLAKIKEYEEEIEAKKKKAAENKRKKLLKGGQPKKATKRKLTFSGTSKPSKSLKESDASPAENEDNLIESLFVESDDEESFIRSISPMQEHTTEVTYEEPQWDKLTAGVFVLVDLVGGPRNKTHYKYVCCITNMDEDDGEIFVDGYQRKDDISTQFIAIDNDSFTITFDQIIAILPFPDMQEIERKLVYVFPGSVSVFEK